MELSGITIVIGILAGFFIFNRMLRQYLISKALKQSYEQKLHKLLTDPNAQPKGRFD